MRRASSAVMMPCLASIAACALLAAISWRKRCRSKSMEALISSMTASGLVVKRPPHILLLMTRLPGRSRARSVYVDSDRFETRSRLLAWSHFLRKTGSPLFRKMLLNSAPDMTGSEEAARPPAKKRLAMIVAGGIAAVALAAVYGIAAFTRNAPDAACGGAIEAARRVAPLARGEVA